MNGRTHRIAHHEWATAVVLDDKRVLLTAHDNTKPHRIVKDIATAEALLGDKLHKWESGRPERSDDAWTGAVRFNDQTLATITARSLATYGDPARPPELEVPEEPEESAPAAPAKKPARRRKAG